MRANKFNQLRMKQNGSIGLIFLIVITIALVIGGVIFGKKILDKRTVQNLNHSMILFAGRAQQYSDLNGVFFENLNKPSEELSLVAQGAFDGPTYINTLGSESKIGLTGISGVKGNEMYVTLKSVPQKYCNEIIHEFENNFPIIAIGQADDNNVGEKTDMYIKNIYSKRETNKDFVKEMCEKYGQMTKSVNITFWFLSKTPLVINGVSLDQYMKTEKRMITKD